MKPLALLALALTVAAGGLRWHVQVAGDGPVLLLLHGTGAATHSWRDLLPLLAERFTVVAPDLPGHGRSDGPVPETYVSLGPEDVRDRSDADGAGALHRFTVSVISEARGFAAAKSVAGAVGDALLNGELALGRGRLVGLWFERASARRSGRAGQVRRIDLRFRARVEDN